MVSSFLNFQISGCAFQELLEICEALGSRNFCGVSEAVIGCQQCLHNKVSPASLPVFTDCTKNISSAGGEADSLDCISV